MTVHLIMLPTFRGCLYNPLNKDGNTINWINWERAVDRLANKLASGSTITRIFVKSVGAAQ
jgi:hypothetical protein